MAGPRQVFKNLNCYFANKSFAGSVVDFTPPKRQLQTEDFRGGGMDAPIELTLGMQKLNTDFTLISISPPALSSIKGSEGADTSFIIREALEDWDKSVSPREIIMRGKVTGIDEGTHTPGQKSQLKVSMNLNYFSDTIDGNMVTEIDIINMRWLNNNIDSLADIRSALGL